MAIPGDELREIWNVTGTKVTAGGDAASIRDLLTNHLDKIKTDWSGWITLYRHRDTGQLWELSYPTGEMHGGGPRQLRCLDIEDQEKWTTLPRPKNW